MMTDDIFGLLKDEVMRLIGFKINLLIEYLRPEFSRNQEFKTWISHLENEKQKLEKFEMVLAVIGTMKAGKSTTINAIVGMEILPNRETAMTILPTLIRNKHGQTEPVLKIEKIAPLLYLSKYVAKKLKQLSDAEIDDIDLHGIDDGKSLIEELIAQNGYVFKIQYQGQTAIFEFLRHLNDIMRLAKDVHIDIEPPYSEYENVEDLPVIEVEFCHLKDHQDLAQGNLAILDTPSPNEFGQSTALRNVFKNQLEKASAILLVTDFTQMKTEADQGLRVELSKIKKFLSKDRLAVVVNKFDQANRNSMSSEDLKNYVAGTLMEDDVDLSQVFPVSSMYAYLANRAKSHLEYHEKLPSPDQEPWVVDFAETALGRRWENKIDDINEVKASIEELWKDSLFAEVVDKVIKEAQVTAKSKSLYSAIAKLDYYSKEFLNLVILDNTDNLSAINRNQESLDHMLLAKKTNTSMIENEIDSDIFSLKLKAAQLSIQANLISILKDKAYQISKQVTLLSAIIKQTSKFEEFYLSGYKEKLYVVCKKNYVAEYTEDIFLEWLDEVIAIKERYIYILKSSINQDVAINILILLENYRNYVDDFFLTECIYLIHKYDDNPKSKFLQKIDMRQMLFKSCYSISLKLKINLDTLLTRQLDNLLDISINANICDLLQSEIIELKQRNFEIYLADIEQYGYELEQHFKAVKSLIYKMKKDLEQYQNK